ncbi:MAG: DUF721 domain-containing protein [Bacteroidota bacterium]|nr:DUF721 domain-containing protein [Bacteroidota bacterium]
MKTNRRHNSTLDISTLIQAIIKDNKLESGILQANIKQNWSRIMGSAVANRTENIQLKGGTLYIKFNSAVLREEFSYKKQELINLLNDQLNTKIITEIIFQ